jgi:hypothetical protein
MMLALCCFAGASTRRPCSICRFCDVQWPCDMLLGIHPVACSAACLNLMLQRWMYLGTHMYTSEDDATCSAGIFNLKGEQVQQSWIQTEPLACADPSLPLSASTHGPFLLKFQKYGSGVLQPVHSHVHNATLGLTIDSICPSSISLQNLDVC